MFRLRSRELESQCEQPSQNLANWCRQSSSSMKVRMRIPGWYQDFFSDVFQQSGILVHAIDQLPFDRISSIGTN